MAKKRNPKAQRRRPKSPFDGPLKFSDLPFDELLDRLFDTFFQQRRFNGDETGGRQPASPLTGAEGELYAEIVELGFRESIKRYHPDREGGSADKCAAINALRDKVRRLAGVKK